MFSRAECAAALRRGSPLVPNGRPSALPCLPTLSRAFGSEENLEQFAATLSSEGVGSHVLVIGGGTRSSAVARLLRRSEVVVLETDAWPGPQTKLVCDAHDLPFADGSFHGVVIQAVLEHVVDPYRCVEEIHRVLAPGGLVYAETPFMQQVHGGRHDFTRFTHLGHRCLFRRFEELAAGAVCGPGMALAWSWQYFLLSFARSALSRRLLSVVARLTAFWLPYLDRSLIRRPEALDAASAVYFLGRRSDRALTDRELIALYRGGAYTGAAAPWYSGPEPADRE